MWARHGDLSRCMGTLPPDHAACRRIYWTYYLWPRLQKELEHLLTPKKKPPIPDPGPLMPGNPQLATELASALLAERLGEPNPQPSISAELRIEVTKSVREGIAGFAKQLDEEIEQLGKQQ